MKFKPLTTNERAEHQYTWVGTITADDLTQTVVATAQTIEFCKLQAGDQVQGCIWHVKTLFTGPAITTVALTVGDIAGVATHIATADIGVAGVANTWKAGNVQVLYVAADKLACTFTPAAGQALNTVNRGEVLIYAKLIRVKNVSDGQAATAIAKT